LKKTKNTFIVTTVITAYIICDFLCVGSWGHIEEENKGKKENSKTASLPKIHKRERTYPVKEKKKESNTKSWDLLHLDFKKMKQAMQNAWT
jgi:hypothetical protein